jgi:hypothetical protein
MTCNKCDVTEVVYEGNGIKLGYSFPFPYVEQSDIKVDRWDDDTLEWVEVPSSEWSITNNTVVEFNTPPDYKFKIYRCTDIFPLAVFHPGHPIQARDLNDNFEQTGFAIEENACAIENLQEESGDYWKKYGETLYSTNAWESCDCYIATAKAVDRRLDEILLGYDRVTGADQDNKRWDSSKTDDEHVATTSALVKRHDTVLASSGGSTAYQQPGKFWVDDSHTLYYRKDTGTQWVEISTRGPQGAAATVDVGTTTTSASGGDAQVTNSGTVSEAIFDFVIPRGEKGEKGDPGSGIHSITGTSPILVTTTDPYNPSISIYNATPSSDGAMSAIDKTKLNSIESGAQVNVAHNLGYITAANKGTVTITNGNNTDVPIASTTIAGLMSAADKTTLDTIASNPNGLVSVTAGNGISVDTTLAASPKISVVFGATDSNVSAPTTVMPYDISLLEDAT